jgi:hypothetical protein
MRSTFLLPERRSAAMTIGTHRKEQKFFGSFFQKRTSSFLHSNDQ